MDSYSIHVTTKRKIDEYWDGPSHITHKGVRYKVQGATLSCDVVGSTVNIYVPIVLPGGSFGNKVVWIYHYLNYAELTTTQKKRFFPRRYFTATWGKNFKFPKAA